MSKEEILPPLQDGHVGNSNISETTVKLEDLPTNALKAIIRRLNEKSQRSAKIFDGDYCIKESNIKNLIEKIGQEFSGRTKLSVAASVTLVLENNQRFDFRSWEEFAQFDRSQPERTKSLSIEVTVDILDNEGTPQRYKCQLSVQNTPRSLGFMVGPIGIQTINNFGIPPVPIHSIVEFNDFIVGKNLQATIDNWEKSIPRQASTWRTKVQKVSGAIRNLLIFCATLSSIWACRVFIPTDNPQVNYQFFLLGGFLIYSTYTIANFLARKFEKYIDKDDTLSNLTLTAGDENYNALAGKKQQSTALAAAAFFGTALSQIALNLASDVIASRLGL